MLNIFFNPYAGTSTDTESGKKSLLSTANTCKKLTEVVQISAHDLEGCDSIRLFKLSIDKIGITYSPPHLLREFSGREKDLVVWFLRLFDKGARVKSEDLSICEDWVLCGLNTAAPILEYALRRDGMSVTITDDSDWKSELLYFIGQPKELPNIYGQNDISVLKDWIQNWCRRNLEFRSFIEHEYNIQFCPGALNDCPPTSYEEKGIENALNRAKKQNFKIDNNLIKLIQTKYGNILELRSFGDGLRLFFVLKDGQPIVGGFYRKSEAICQAKAINYSAKRLKDHEYI